MDIVTLSLAKQHTDSQRLAYAEKKTVTYDGNPDGKLQFPTDIDGCMFVKISDEVIRPNDITKVHFTVRAENGETYTETNMLSADNGVCAYLGPGEGGVSLAWIPTDNQQFWSNLFTEGTNVVGCLAEPQEGLEKGTYVISGYRYLGANYYYCYVSLIEWETIHPIDPKYLPGVCLPVVELSTELLSEDAFTILNEADSAAMEAILESGAKFIIAVTSVGNGPGCTILRKDEDGIGFWGSYAFPGVHYSYKMEGMVLSRNPEDGVWYFGKLTQE